MQSKEIQDKEKQSTVEDLTLDEAVTENIKGGFLLRFGVEREMKESGEKGGTEG